MTSVTFNGAAASLTVNAATRITATVPAKRHDRPHPRHHPDGHGDDRQPLHRGMKTDPGARTLIRWGGPVPNVYATVPPRGVKRVPFPGSILVGIRK